MAIPNANQLGLPSLKESFKIIIVFVRPEILLDKNLIDNFHSPTLTARLVAFVIDEVDCVKKW